MSKGGRRWGAGRPGRRARAEHCKQIDVRRWQREGMLVPGAAGGWYWYDADTGQETASIARLATASAVVLSFAIDGRPVTQHVPILRTSCTYGGSRPWFGCPACARRVAVLYLRGQGFACRHCQDVAYACQSEDVVLRSWRKQRKVEAKLGGESWPRPRGMHATTYASLLETILNCQDRRTTVLAHELDHLMPGWRQREL